ncbi:hypothetical protein BDZ85DRAFT_263098 [Elsinoe ampelina]|uniref:Uncharacterized protein n=1 Tax=Elsinoe ampelina TaxID=302913 RepID=A0A6A6GBR0_9PEZI|nr:hypothetical protein BDZ85DRAFT_263098 [Elsinoe ampelina]
MDRDRWRALLFKYMASEQPGNASFIYLAPLTPRVPRFRPLFSDFPRYCGLDKQALLWRNFTYGPRFNSRLDLSIWPQDNHSPFQVGTSILAGASGGTERDVRTSGSLAEATSAGLVFRRPGFVLPPSCASKASYSDDFIHICLPGSGLKFFINYRANAAPKPMRMPRTPREAQEDGRLVLILDRDIRQDTQAYAVLGVARPGINLEDDVTTVVDHVAVVILEISLDEGDMHDSETERTRKGKAVASLLDLDADLVAMALAATMPSVPIETYFEPDHRWRLLLREGTRVNIGQPN